MRSSALPPQPHTLRVFGAPPLATENDLLALAFAPDGSLWAIEEPGLLRHWNAVNQQPLESRVLEEAAPLWAFAPGARYVAAASENVVLFDPRTGRRLAELPGQSWVTALCFAPLNVPSAPPLDSLIAVGAEDGNIRIWEYSERLFRAPTNNTAALTSAFRLLHTLEGHLHEVSALAFSADGSRLASAGEGKVICIWDVVTGQLLGRLRGHTDRIPGVVWHPDNRRLFSAGWDSTVRVWDTQQLEPIILLNSHAAQVHALALNPTGELLASADSGNVVHLWDTQRYNTRHVLPEQAGEVRCLTFSTDGQRLASGGADRLIHLWVDRQGETQLADFEEGDPVQARAFVAVSPPCSEAHLFGLITGSTLRAWDLETGRTAFPLEGEPRLRSFALSPCGNWLAAARVEQGKPEWNGGPPLDRRTLSLYNARTGQHLTLLEGQPGPITALAFRPDQPNRLDGELLASAGYQSSDVWLWNVPEGTPRLLIPGAVEGCGLESLAFHPQGKLLAVAGIDWLATSGASGAVTLWDVETGRQVSQWRIGARVLAFSPQGQLLAFATLDSVIQVWNWSQEHAGTTITLRGHQSSVNCLAFSPNGKFLVSGGEDSTVRLWDISLGRQTGAFSLNTPVKAVVFSADGTQVITGNGNTSCYLLQVEALLHS